MWSNIVSKTLGKVGANQWMRKRYYEYSTIQCIGNVFLNLYDDGSYRATILNTQRFGSFIEGTTTIGMKSDIDEIDIELNNVIEQGEENHELVDEKTVVVVADMSTPPGFVKMKIDKRGRYRDFMIETNENGDSFLSNTYTDDYKQHMATLFQVGQTPSDLEKHGPALTNFNEQANQIESIDSIIAFHCKSGLSFTKAYFHRQRLYGWPSKSTLDMMGSQGCLLVPTGHSRCDKKNRIFQWRVSFSFQERHLMLNLNSAQHKCYVLLKLVKKSHISPFVGLTSYHCKTALFYTIENTAGENWTEDNLLNCFLLCLKRLRRWSRRHYCPNYFLPELNLFTGKIRDQDICKLTHILSNLIQNPQHYLRQISLDNFGSLIKMYAGEASVDCNIEAEVDTNVAKKLHKLLVDVANAVFHIKNIVLQKITFRCNDVNEAIARHYKWLAIIGSLQDNNFAGQYSLDGVQWALPHVCRFLHSSLASHLAIKASETDNAQMRSWFIVTAAYLFWKGLNSDAMSGKMKLATYLLFSGHLSFDILRSKYWPTGETQSLCDCTTSVRGNLIQENEYQPFIDMFRSSRQETLEMSTSHYIEKYISACTIFLPSECKLTLYPLQFEMHRSFGSPVTIYDEYQQLNTKRSNCEFDNCATLDSKIYCILLSIYTSGREEREKHERTLLMYAKLDNLAHRETTFNVLGWLASAQEISQSSLVYYKNSWVYNILQQETKLPPMQVRDKNAAKWHLAILYYRVWLFRNIN